MSEDSALIVYATRAMELIRKLRAKARRRYQELETCRAALDKTAIERDGFHGELTAARGMLLKMGLQLQDAMKVVEAVRVWRTQPANTLFRLDISCMPLPEPPQETM